MKKIMSALVIASLASLPLSAGTATASMKAEEGEFSVTVTTTAAETPGEILFTAVFTNVTTGKVISAPRVTFKSGTGAEVLSGNDAEGTETRMKISSDPDKNTATAAIEYKQNGEVIFAPMIVFDLK